MTVLDDLVKDGVRHGLTAMYKELRKDQRENYGLPAKDFRYYSTLACTHSIKYILERITNA